MKARRPLVEAVRPAIRALPAFRFEPRPEVPRRYKLDQNESPWEPPRRLKERIAAELVTLPWSRYPEHDCETLRQALGRRHGWPAEGVLVGNGSNELLATVVEAVTSPGGELLGSVPSFGIYPRYAARAGAAPRFLGPRPDLATPLEELHREIARDPRRPLLLASPNNPTGEALPPDEIARLARALEAPLLLDAAYAELCRHDYRPLLDEHPNLVLFHTFSKAWALAGLRVGYLLGRPELVAEIAKASLPFNVGWAGAAAALATLAEAGAMRRRVAALRARRERWAEMLRGLGLEVFPSEANFLLVRFREAGEAGRVHSELAARGILVRDVGSGPGLAGCLRVTVGDGGALRAARRALGEVVGGFEVPPSHRAGSGSPPPHPWRVRALPPHPTLSPRWGEREMRKMSTRRAIPHLREFLADSLTPLGAYRRLGARSPTRFLLESVTGGDQVSRFSFLGAAPREILRLWPDRLERERDGRREDLPGAPLAALAGVLGSIASAPAPVPFTGGYVGFFGYDAVRLVERLPARPPDPFGLPLALLARFDSLAVFDHAHQRVLAVANEVEGESDAADAERELGALAEVLTSGAESGAVPIPAAGPAQRADPAALEAPSLGGAEFRRAVRTVKRHIAAGDVFQAVLARRFRVARRVEPLALYRALRVINPSPYMVLLETPDAALAGASPEMLVRKTGSRIETRPIAGTRPRGADAEGDRRLARDLAADPKERAEHVMLVDLGRNDLGRVSEPGSVRVTSFQEIERYSHVMHLVSSVEGRLAAGRTGLDALLACFPAGTLSGAPKIRAMEIIDELEPEARGPYGGAVGYLSYSGDVDTCITIRTLVVRGEETSVTAGAGIVADSEPEREERETEEKAAGMLAAVALAERIAGKGEV